MSNVSLYDTMINYLDTVYQVNKAENAAKEVLIAIDDASVMLTVAKDTGEDCAMAAVGRLMAAGLTEEADGLFNIWWES